MGIYQNVGYTNLHYLEISLHNDLSTLIQYFITLILVRCKLISKLRKKFRISNDGAIGDHSFSTYAKFSEKLSFLKKC